MPDGDEFDIGSWFTEDPFGFATPEEFWFFDSMPGDVFFEAAPSGLTTPEESVMAGLAGGMIGPEVAAQALGYEDLYTGIARGSISQEQGIREIAQRLQTEGLPDIPSTAPLQLGGAFEPGVEAPPSDPVSWSQWFSNWIRDNPGTVFALGLTGLTGIVGLGAVVEAFTRGDQTTKTTIQQMVGAASPEEQQAFQMAVQGGQTAQTTLGQRQGPEAGLFAQGALGTSALSTLLDPYMAMASNLAGGQIPGLADIQSRLAGRLEGAVPTQTPGLAESLGQTALGMSRGELPFLTPGALGLVDQLYGGAEAQIGGFVDKAMRDAIERANQMGFPTSPSILAQTPTSALFAPSLAEAVRQKAMIESEKARSKLGLATGLPGMAAQLESARMAPGQGMMESLGAGLGGLSTPLAVRGALAQNALALGGTAAGQQVGVSQTGITNLINLIQALSGVGGQLGRGRGQTTLQDTTTPSRGGFTEAFAPLGSLLGGVGGAMGGMAQAALWDRLLRGQ